MLLSLDFIREESHERGVPASVGGCRIAQRQKTANHGKVGLLRSQDERRFSPERKIARALSLVGECQRALRESFIDQGHVAGGHCVMQEGLKVDP